MVGGGWGTCLIRDSFLEIGRELHRKRDFCFLLVAVILAFTDNGAHRFFDVLVHINCVRIVLRNIFTCYFQKYLAVSISGKNRI